MLNPGDYTLAALGITTALTGQAQTSISQLEGLIAATVEVQFAYGSGGTSCKVWIQTTLDAGQTWLDIACFAFTTSSSTKVINISGLTPVTTAIVPTDGSMSDNTVQDGVLGSALRAKITTVGTYAGSTSLSVRASVR
ncbi:hypothetical protein [Bradyrhizobium sp. CCBAU 21365]|uniref:hypothetical protein n=1 Tax=Bradyrhizobium sp. CCBAU 21365 TaxID=1325083 RepID=UPI00188D11C5|nr:hypothetical protein [Bradyrhizobium sp. CCBAU 21365]